MKSEHDDDHQWVVHVDSLIVNGSAHHLDLFLCVEPGYRVVDPSIEPSDDMVWDCSYIVDAGIPGLIKAPRCSDPIDHVVPFDFDQHEMSETYGIGLKVGPKSSFKYLVMEIHYANVSQAQGMCSFKSLTLFSQF